MNNFTIALISMVGVFVLGGIIAAIVKKKDAIGYFFEKLFNV